VNVKTAIITGGTQGIGATLVESFIEADYKVVYSARSEKPSEFGPDAKFVKADVRERTSHQVLVKSALDWTGRLDVYVNNAGVSWWKPLAEIDEKFLEEMLETNLMGTFWGCQAASKALKPGGVIINMSSLAGKRGSANNSAYCAAKFGVNGLTQSLAKELGPKGIRVNAVCPVYVKTENLLEALKTNQSPTGGGDLEAYFESFAKSQSALQRLPEAHEIAKACLFLADEHASAITGQCINVDCGVMPQ
jgi:NAD(P)-dependent dehydrogenase (short-subunit alcohol dehydrogenase family)